MSKNDKFCMVLTAVGLIVVTLLFMRSYKAGAFELDNPNTPMHHLNIDDYSSLFYVAVPEEIVATTYVELEPTVFHPLTEKERKVIECIVEGESGNQKIEGRILVAQCIYNAMVQDSLTPTQVIKEYRYAGWSDTPSELTKEAVSAVFDRGEMGVEENILWFYNPTYSRGGFHNSQKFVIKSQDHLFFAPN